MPENYDSVYLQDESSKHNLEGQYFHTYKIYNQDRVQLLHKVKTKIVVNEKVNQDLKKECAIENCQDDADFYCETDNAYFCDKHNKDFHSLEEHIKNNQNVK